MPSPFVLFVSFVDLNSVFKMKSAVQVAVHDLSQADAWREALAAFAPDDDVYFAPEYLAAHETAGLGRAECVSVVEGDSRLLLTYLRCAIPGHAALCDVQSPNGYGGALVRGGSDDFLARAWAAVFECWRERAVVAAFLRCHPLLGNANAHRGAWQLTHDRNTVAIDLRGGLDAAFGGPLAAKHRRDAARVLRSGYATRELPDAMRAIDAFIPFYERSMARVGADDAYFFPREYYESLITGLGTRVSIFEVADDRSSEAASMGLAMWGRRWAHYHLSASVLDVPGLNFSHALLQGIAEAAVAHGCEMLHLGGGRTAAPDDALLRFKRWIGRHELPFHTAGRVIDEAAYCGLIAEWSGRYGASPRWFLGYRQPFARIQVTADPTT